MMEFKYLTELDDDIIKKYMDLTNNVIRKSHSIGFLESLDFDTTKELLMGKIMKPMSALVVAYDDGTLIGTGYLGPSGYATTRHYGEISKVMVDPNTQGRGIGKKIMDELEKKAIEIGFTHLLLDTWDIDHIIKFYKKCGYAQVGIIPEFINYNGEFHDSYIFAKKL